MLVMRREVIAEFPVASCSSELVCLATARKVLVSSGRGFLAAWGWTVGSGIVGPYWAAKLLIESSPPDSCEIWLDALLQPALGAWFGRQMQRASRAWSARLSHFNSLRPSSGPGREDLLCLHHLLRRTGEVELQFARSPSDFNLDRVQMLFLHLVTKLPLNFRDSVLLEAVAHT
jgi:hypothetical protein